MLRERVEKSGHPGVNDRTDDLLILVRSRRAGERVKTSITAYLTGKVKLMVNEPKEPKEPKEPSDEDQRLRVPRGYLPRR